MHLFQNSNVLLGSANGRWLSIFARGITGGSFAGSGLCDVDYASEILEPLLRQYPNGAVVLFLFGRVAQLRGQFTEALDYFDRSIAAQSEWKQYHHLCIWEMMWSVNATTSMCNGESNHGRDSDEGVFCQFFSRIRAYLDRIFA